MRTPSFSRLAVVVFLTASFSLGAAFVARAQFTGSVTGGPLTISTAASFGPQAPTARVWLCLPGVSVTTIVSWNDAGGRGDVDVLRALSANGPFTPIALHLPLVGYAFDTTRFFSTTVYYAVRDDDGGLSAAGHVDLPGPSCR
jgi:hypothetical protein